MYCAMEGSLSFIQIFGAFVAGLLLFFPFGILKYPTAPKNFEIVDSILTSAQLCLPSLNIFNLYLF